MNMYVPCCVLFEAFDLPQWFHVVLLLVAVSSTFADFKPLQLRPTGEEHVNNKILATTMHVQCVVRNQEGQRKATGQCLLSNSYYPLKIRPVTVIVI